MDNKRIITVGSILSAFAASLCCIGPLIFAVAGLGVFGAATFFASLRPYLLAGAAALLAVGFYFTYRPQKVICEDGTCKTVKAGKGSKTSLWTAAIAVVAFAFSPYFTGYLFPQNSQTASTTTAASLETIKFQVEGMTCGGCAAEVQSALRAVAGVQKAEVSFDWKQATVVFDPAETDRQKLAEAVKKMKGNHGFNAETGAYEDLVRSGIVDPTKVVRSEIQNAASVAGMLLTTEAVVGELPKKEKDMPMPGGMPHDDY